MAKNNRRPEGSDTAEAKVIASAREILKLESAAIDSVASKLGADFYAAVSLIKELAPGGRLVLTGMGKAGFVAQKVSATFASTGIPSFFLHPAEAIHGDLGRFTKSDIAIILSNSGETPEIVRIIPYVRRFGCPIIAITAGRTSSLGKHADLVLELGSLDEAGPHGLAPTTSTTAMLALGDALAMTIFEQHEYSREQFALYHPGGSLGRSLMTVGEIMRTGEEHCVVPEQMITSEVLHKISATKGRPGAAAVVDASGVLSGVFTDGNMRRCLESGTEFLHRPIAENMSRNPRVIAGDRFVTEALRVLSEHKIDQVIVVSADHRPIGLVDIQDLIEFKS